jgi:ribosomal protein S18 acetylase RimI-like enzyme
MKLLLENWNRFLLEGNSLTKLSLFVKESKPRFYIALYEPLTEQHIGESPPKIVGMLTMQLTSQKCIPPSYEIVFVARSSEFKRMGIGSLLYKIAASIASEQEAGITSDHGSSTSIEAYKVWQKIEKSPEFYKRSTSAGNDSFDYDKKTPDLDDDCDDLYGNMRAATDHSFSIEKIPPIYYDLLQNHDEYTKNLDQISKESFERYLISTAKALFGAEHGNSKSLTNSYFSLWSKFLRSMGVGR